MTITLFIEPKSLMIFLEVTKTLEKLPLKNNYFFQSSDLIFTEQTISNWVMINMDIDEYLKLKYCIGVLTNKNH